MIFTTTLAHVRSVALFTADDKEIRRYLRMAYAEPAAEGARIVGTDGLRMLVLIDDAAQFLNRANGPLCFDARAAAKLKGKPNDVIRFDGATAYNTRTGDIVCAPTVLQADTTNEDYLGRFPPWERVVPRTSTEACSAGFDVALLSNFAGVVKAFGGKWPAVTLFGRADDPSATLLVKFWDTRVPGFGVLCPVRTTEKSPAPTAALPAWMDGGAA